MDIEGSISKWIGNLRERDEQAAQALWETYFQRLVRLAHGRLPNYLQRDFDAEDVAISAFHSLCRGVSAGRFPHLEDRDNVWSLLVVITARKAMRALRDRQAAKRGSGEVVGESVFSGSDGELAGIGQIIGKEPTPEFACEVAETAEALFAALPDDQLRDVARLKAEGFTTDEIADKLGSARRTVARRLALIRKLWSSYSEDDPPT